MVAGLTLLLELEVTTGRAELAWESGRLLAIELLTQPSSGGGRFAVRVANLSLVDAEIGCK